VAGVHPQLNKEIEMATFMTRVELHNANYQDYANLHTYMAQEGFSNTIRSDAGAVYQLPPAEYNLIANCLQSDAIERAKRAATKTRKAFAVIVSEYSGCTWHGLAEVKQAARAY
jgi:hypothetical protein